MKIPFLDLSRKHHRQFTELNRIYQHCLLEDFVAGGEAINRFERAFATYLDISHCIGCGNGTDALEIILRALNIGEGDEVIVPANAWLSAAEMVKLLGAVPIFVDVDPLSCNIDPLRIEAGINPKTKAIIPIHLYGQPADMHAILEIAKKHHLYVIEDCAQAHGASISEKKVGSWGHAAAFSFYPTKNLGALGDAGAIATADPELAQKCRMIANHGQLTRDQHQLVGRNSRMDTLQAAVLEYRLQRLDSENQKRRQWAALYRLQLAGLPLDVPHEREDFYHIYHLFAVRTNKRDELKEFLYEKGIGTVIHYPQAVSDMKHLNPKYCQIASDQSKELLSLPLYPELSEDEVMQVCDSVKKFFQ